LNRLLTLEIMLSIITISKDDPEGLNHTLSSTQDVASVEHIVVLGGNHLQPSIEILHLFNCITIQQLDQGISAAFNLGLTQATGLGVMFLNGGDSLLDPSLVTNALDCLEKHPEIDILLYDAIFDDAIAGPYLYRAQQFYGSKLNRIGLGMPGSHQAMIVRRSSFDRVGLFNPDCSVAMDYDWLCRWHKTSTLNRCACFMDFPPVVKVDGKGVSISREPLCLYECFLALWKNDLLLVGRYGVDYVNRLLRFCARHTMIKLKLNTLVAKIKRWKHR
jgi:hypothetical protein